MNKFDTYGAYQKVRGNPAYWQEQMKKAEARLERAQRAVKSAQARIKKVAKLIKETSNEI